jgi:proline dehydrogenase
MRFCRYPVVKYMPYGQLQQTLPYLVRRAQENHAVLNMAQHDEALFRRELAARAVDSLHALLPTSVRRCPMRAV